jgi:hypothetical protein
MAGDIDRRMYKESELPVIPDNASLPEDNKREILLAEYSEAASAWRMLTDVRFKLLALIPPISALAITAIVSPRGLLEGAANSVRVAAAAFGFLVVAGLCIYDARNSELYDDLISRGRRTEMELGIHAGVFRGRLRPKRKIISHGPALQIVYGVVLLAWVLAGFTAALGVAH